MKLLYHPKVKTDDIPRLDNTIAPRIKKAIEGRLVADPLKYGFFLHGSLHGYRKMRVSDWRVVYQLYFYPFILLFPYTELAKNTL